MMNCQNVNCLSIDNLINYSVISFYKFSNYFIVNLGTSFPANGCVLRIFVLSFNLIVSIFAYFAESSDM